MWPIGSMLKSKQNYRDISDQVQFVIETRQDNDIIDPIATIYDENEIELSWLIGLGADYDENLTGQLR